MIIGGRGSILRWLGKLILAVLLVVGLLAGWQWFASEQYSIRSSALQEIRTYRVFNQHSDGPVVYSLDGNSLRNSLAPAALFSFAAILRSRDLPKVVAISSNAGRDRDFRPSESTPQYWRPRIVGHAEKFDAFLLGELQPKIEGEETGRVRSYLMGHSLSGLYALDLATREPEKFAGVFAFAPTFSHDSSIGERLPKSCHGSSTLYANWGLESARDTAIFEATAVSWKADVNCRQNPPLTPRHHGSLHQTIMLSGQFHVAFLLLE